MLQHTLANKAHAVRAPAKARHPGHSRHPAPGSEMIEPGWVVRNRPIVHVDPQSNCPGCEDDQARLLWLLSNARLLVYALCAWLGMTAALVVFRLL